MTNDLTNFTPRFAPSVEYVMRAISTTLSLLLVAVDLQVTSDIHDDAERQNLVLDETVRFFYFLLCSTSPFDLVPGTV